MNKDRAASSHNRKSFAKSKGTRMIVRNSINNIMEIILRSTIFILTDCTKIAIQSKINHTKLRKKIQPNMKVLMVKNVVGGRN